MEKIIDAHIKVTCSVGSKTLVDFKNEFNGIEQEREKNNMLDNNDKKVRAI